MMHRYPGPRSFTGDDRHLFFGRDAEKQELFRLIVLNDLVVLFGESGCGKTSLLQAGVCPDLEAQQYKPVFLRLNSTDEAPELQVCHQLKEGGYLPADMPEDRTMWEYFSRFWYVDLGEVHTPVVVFDQFEELFTLYQPEQRAAFIEQFAAIANRRPPAGLSPDAATPPQAKFVFSLRSDFLYLLDELSADIPSILRCRFQLRLLDRNGASDAITKPAAMPGEYASPVFGYSAVALEGILGALAAKVGEVSNLSDFKTDVKTTEIASFQLQLVCRHLEDKVIHEKRQTGFQITPDFYGGAEGIRQIIEDFYNQVIEKIAPAEREAVEKLLARGLIRNGRRIMMEASAMRDEHGVSQAALELLHDERLLKREARKGELYYEISHDTLVKPVLDRFIKIEEAERTAEAERLRLHAAEDKRRLDEAERLTREAVQGRKRARTFTRLAGAVATVAIGLGVLALFKQREAEKTALTAYANDLAYKSKTALRDGDRNAAFRLAEFAHRYVDADNSNVVQALSDALYYHDQPPLPRVTTLEGHKSSVNTVAFSLDGKRLMTASDDNTTKIWELNSPTMSKQGAKALMTFPTPGFGGVSSAFSPDRKRLATWGGHTIEIWALDVMSGSVPVSKPLITLEGGASHDVTRAAFSPDGKRLAAGFYDGLIKIWDLTIPQTSGLASKPLMTLEGHTGWIRSVVFSPDGKRLATGSYDSTAKIWRLDIPRVSGQVLKPLMTLEGHTEGLWSVAFSPDGKRLATGSGDNTARIWELDIPRVSRRVSKPLMTLEGHTDWVTSVMFSPDGKRLATGSNDNTAKIWDLDIPTVSGQVAKVLMTLKGHAAGVQSVAFSPACPDDPIGGKWLATGSEDHTAKIWDLDSNKALLALKGHASPINSIAYSPDGKRLATGSWDHMAIIWDLDSNKVLLTLKDHTSAVQSIAFSPDGKRLATAADSTVKIWDLDIPMVAEQPSKPMMILKGHTSGVMSVAFSPDGKRLATASWNNTAKIWDLDIPTVSGQVSKPLMTLEDNGSPVFSVAFSPNGKWLATGSFDKTAKIWDLNAPPDSGQVPKPLMTLYGHSSYVNSVAFSPDGKRLATGSGDGTAKIWNLANRKALMTLEGHGRSVFSVAFSPACSDDPNGGKRLATWSGDQTAKIWDMDSGKALMTLEGQNSDVSNIAFSPDGKQLATGYYDNTVKIWEISADSLLRHWQEEGGRGELTLPQLQQYNLEALLDQHPDNEQRLIATREVWQIKAFADLTSLQAAGSNVLNKVNPLYARADRLYAAALALQDEPLIQQDYAVMLRRWAEVYWSEGRAAKRAELEARANALEAKMKLEENIRYRVQYVSAVEQLEAEYEASPTDSLRTILVGTLINKCWYQLLTGQLAEAEATVGRGLELDAGSAYLHVTLAPLLLLQGKTEAARQEYEQWKEKPVRPGDSTTCRVPFLDDLKTMEAAGIIPAERAAAVEAVRKMLGGM